MLHFILIDRLVSVHLPAIFLVLPKPVKPRMILSVLVGID